MEDHNKYSLSIEDKEDIYLLQQVRRLIDRAIEDRIEVASLRAEVEMWRKMHSDVVNDSIRHSEAMMGNLLLFAIRSGR